MKKTLNYIKNILIILYVLLIIFITICLLSFNDYRVTEFGNVTLLPVIDDNLEPDYTVGDLLLVTKKVTDIAEGDTVFFYKRDVSGYIVTYAEATDVEIISSKECTITVNDDYAFPVQELVGKASTAKIIPKLGYVVSLLESKFGFLFLGVLPSLLIFLYTGYSLFLEMTTEDVEVEEKNKKNKKEKEVVKKTEENTSKEEVKEPEKQEENNSASEEEQKRALIEEKMKTMTEEQKRALIEAKLKTMTEEQKKALLEAKRKKMEENK